MKNLYRIEYKSSTYPGVQWGCVWANTAILAEKKLRKSMGPIDINYIEIVPFVTRGDNK